MRASWLMAAPYDDDAPETDLEETAPESTLPSTRGGLGVGLLLLSLVPWFALFSLGRIADAAALLLLFLIAAAALLLVPAAIRRGHGALRQPIASRLVLLHYLAFTIAGLVAFAVAALDAGWAVAAVIGVIGTGYALGVFIWTFQEAEYAIHAETE